MNHIARNLVLPILVGLPLLLATGCKTVVRENIISSVETGLGITLAENPKTELYEAKIGYIRSQFYSVPTGKVVENEDCDDCEENGDCCGLAGRQDMRSNRADITPQLVSGIKMSSGAKHLFIGADISENFAVGETAVMSPAAVAMYVSQAGNPQSAKAAAEAVTGYVQLDDPDLRTQQSELDKLLQKKLKAGTKLDGKDFGPDKTRDYADALGAKKKKTVSTIRRMGGKNLEELIAELKKVTTD